MKITFGILTAILVVILCSKILFHVSLNKEFRNDLEELDHILEEVVKHNSEYKEYPQDLNGVLGIDKSALTSLQDNKVLYYNSQKNSYNGANKKVGYTFNPEGPEISLGLFRSLSVAGSVHIVYCPKKFLCSYTLDSNVESMFPKRLDSRWVKIMIP